MSTADMGASWGVVADDLTGAADAGVQLTRAGLAVRVHVSGGNGALDDRSPHGVDVLVTEARHLDVAAADAVTADAVEALLLAGVDRVYLKVDSAGRGSIGPQVNGALRALRARRTDARALVCPAYPALRRTVEGGVVLVDGVASTASPAADDPVAPPVTADLRVVWPSVDVEVADAADDAQLAGLARRVLDSPELLAVGSAGLLARLVDAGAPTDRDVRAAATGSPDVSGAIVVASSSLHPMALRQLDELNAAARAALIVVPAPTEPLAPDAAARQFGERVAAAVVAAHTAPPVAALVLVGGDGALAALRHLGARRIDLDGSLREGVPTGIIVGGAADGIRVATKSGGFGDPQTLIELVAALRHPDLATPYTTRLATPQKEQS